MTLVAIMKYKLLPSLALVTLGITAIAPMVNAGMAKDNYTGKIYSTGHAPRDDVYVYYLDAPLTKKVSANECGIVQISLGSIPHTGSTEVTLIGVGPATLSSFPVMAKADAPKCSNGVATNIPAEGKARYVPNAETGNQSLVWTGQTPFTQYDITFPIPKERKLKSNACGVATISSSSSYPSTGTFRMGASPTVHNFATVTGVNAPPGCKNNTLLLPVGFPN